uniref:DHT03 protein B n=1 Tax=synthetic construct TaxID=32630 RepID=UPI002279E6E5|nr:Chain B, DHT03 protein B [synthetic construct]7UPQ_E Chain E, DHT03 protein B [synthetic construct]7UPQ_H Chain H, DHT03 protein B [synthetic construct]7UPQ_K Chain K, DHT03 protein B [synthetic construct]
GPVDEIDKEVKKLEEEAKKSQEEVERLKQEVEKASKAGLDHEGDSRIFKKIHDVVTKQIKVILRLIAVYAELVAIIG